MKRGSKPRISGASVSDTRLSETLAPPSAEITSHEVVVLSSVANKISFSSSSLPTNTNLSVASSGLSEGVGIFPPTDASASLPEGTASRDRHSLKRRFESEDVPVLFNQFLDFIDTKKRATVSSHVSSAPAALGAPPPDASFLFPLGNPHSQKDVVSCDVGGNVRSVPIFSFPDIRKSSGSGAPSLTVNQHAMGRSGLYAHFHAPRLQSDAFAFNSSGMLNRTGQVDRHYFPPSLTLPSRSSDLSSRPTFTSSALPSGGYLTRSGYSC